MSNTDPIFIEHPGAGRLRSQTLDEYMAALDPTHPARAELAQIRALALEGMKTSHDLITALQKVDALQKEIDLLKTPKAADLAVEAGLTEGPASAQFACPECGKSFASPQGIKMHIYHKHSKPNAQAPA